MKSPSEAADRRAPRRVRRGKGGLNWGSYEEPERGRRSESAAPREKGKRGVNWGSYEEPERSRRSESAARSLSERAGARVVCVARSQASFSSLLVAHADAAAAKGVDAPVEAQHAAVEGGHGPPERVAPNLKLKLSSRARGGSSPTERRIFCFLHLVTSCACSLACAKRTTRKIDA